MPKRTTNIHNYLIVSTLPSPPIDKGKDYCFSTLIIHFINTKSSGAIDKAVSGQKPYAL